LISGPAVSRLGLLACIQNCCPCLSGPGSMFRCAALVGEKWSCSIQYVEFEGCDERAQRWQISEP
jgi:hypothetical protein